MPDSRFEQIKKLTIIALVSDDDLMEKLVLKGGNALQFIHGAPIRQSLDLDFSVDGDLDSLDETRVKLERLLTETFRSESLVPFDIRLDKAPPNLREDVIGDFWGGYTLEFKVLTVNDYRQLESRPEKRPLRALELGPDQRRAFTVDFSKHEYCVGKLAKQIDGYTVYVYSGLMIACEKIRAICQQMPEYRAVVKSGSRRPRARDFVDIHFLCDRAGVELSNDDAWQTLVQVFRAKRVDLRLLAKISDEREFHRENFASVRDTVDAKFALKGFDFYVDDLVQRLKPLQPRWEENTPAG